jgi:hypothetical protein
MNSDIAVRTIRLLLAVSLAAIVPCAFLISVTLIGKAEPPKYYVKVISFIVGSNWLLWLFGTLAIALRARRSGVRHVEFQIFGAGLAFIHPLFAIFAVQHFMPLVIPDISGSDRPVETPVAACLMAGLLEVPFGVFAAWILWRLGFPSLKQVFAGSLRKASRPLHCISRMRLIIFVLLAPMPAATAATILFLLAPPEFISPAPIWVFSITGALAAAWGALFMKALSYLQDIVSRGNCLFFGATAALLLPGTWAIVGSGITRLFGLRPTILDLIITGSFFVDMGSMFILGSLLMPFGMFGGWLMWQAGIAPTPNPEPIEASATAFD